jgi:DNA-binding transcriptional LysR family regulator
MSDRLQELNVFVRTAESGSFSRAGRELALSQPSVSRIINELEARLGVKLLLRTTRRVAPTEAGNAFLERAKQVLHDIEAAEDVARGVDSLRGLIRIALPVTFGVRKIVPVLQPFLAAHPMLKLDLVMSDDREDLAAEGIDVAMRLGELTSAGSGARQLAAAQRMVIASPAYLARRGVPQTPAELALHDCIFGPAANSPASFSFLHNGAESSIELEARLSVTSGEGVMACVKAGLGIAIATDWMCRADLRSGTVVRVLQDHRLAETVAHAVYPAGPRPSAKVRALVDYLAAALA